MKDFLVAVKSFIILHKKAIIITASSIVGLAILAAGVVMIASKNYLPTSRCLQFIDARRSQDIARRQGVEWQPSKASHH
jgi:hypothetical protein